MNKVLDGLEGVAWTAAFILFIHWLLVIGEGSLFDQKFEYISGWYWVICLLTAIFLSNYNSKY